VVRVAVTAKIGLGVGALVAAGLRLRATVRDWDPAEEDWDPAGLDLPVHDRGAPAPEPALATVLAWPGPRRSGTLDDPDLPGGA
jgi:hypothetical protein